MNTFYKYLIAAFLFGSYMQSKAQPVPVNWQFESPIDSGLNPSTAPTSVSAGYTAANATVAGVTASVSHPGGDGSGPNNTYYGYSATGWPTANAIDLGKYYEFSIATVPGCTFTLAGFRFAVRFDGEANYEVRTSYDNYAAPWGAVLTGATQGNFNGFTRSSSSGGAPAGISGQTNLTFRIYFYNVSVAGYPMVGDLVPGRSIIDRVQVFATRACPMPVEFASFEGKAVGNHAQLNWVTSWERNADRFEVQRSQDAAEFGAVGQVKAAGDATEKQVYGFTDEQALSGVNYYRLRQVDKDGSVQFSKIIAVTTRPEAPAIAVLGNPTEGGRINLQLFNVEASKLQLTDMQGRSLPFRVVESAGGIVTMEPTSPLGSGLYLVRAAKVPAIKIVVR